MVSVGKVVWLMSKTCIGRQEWQGSGITDDCLDIQAILVAGQSITHFMLNDIEMENVLATRGGDGEPQALDAL